jgi:hypothetical protein
MNSTIERIIWGLACMCMLALAVNHTAYEKGAYMGTWVLLGAVYTCALLACRPKYRVYVEHAIKYGFLTLLPYAVPVVAVAVGVWFVHNPGWFLLVIVAGPILWALSASSDIGSREVHHDSRPGSYYYESNKKRD